MTRIQLCGPLAVELEGRKVLPPGRQGRLLLAYLIVNRGRACRRDELIELRASRLEPSTLEITSRGFLVGDEAPWIEERRRDVAELRLRALEAIAAGAEPAAGGNVAEALRAYEDL